MRPRALDSILGGGLLAGVLDILDAIIFWGLRGISAERIFQSVASGLLGRSAFQGGMATVILGGALHFFIATTAAAVYFAASLKLPVLVRRAVPCGLAFGVAVYFFMNYAVLPLSAVTPSKGGFSLLFFANGVLGHALLVGLPIALVTRRSADPGRGALLSPRRSSPSGSARSCRGG